MNNPFTVEETNLICIFQSDNRMNVMKDINRALKYIDNRDMMELCENVLEKLGKMMDEDYQSLDIEFVE